MKCLCLLASAVALADTTLIESDFASRLVTKPVPYAVLLPENFSKTEKPLPLLLKLHGGGRDRTEVGRTRATIEALVFEAGFGWEVGWVYWEEKKRVSSAKADRVKLRNSGLKIYLDAGKEDLFHLDEGTEFLHRILYDARITHEYHYVYGADHIGASLRARQMEALEFLTSVLNPKPPDPAAGAARERYAPLKAKFGVD